MGVQFNGLYYNLGFAEGPPKKTLKIPQGINGFSSGKTHDFQQTQVMMVALQCAWKTNIILTPAPATFVFRLFGL
jgi:hypothetical protein